MCSPVHGIVGVNLGKNKEQTDAVGFDILIYTGSINVLPGRRLLCWCEDAGALRGLPCREHLVAKHTRYADEMHRTCHYKSNTGLRSLQGREQLESLMRAVLDERSHMTW